MAYSINDNGQIAGYSEDFGAAAPAFLWQASTGLQDLNPSIGENTSFAKGINSLGQVVGSSAFSQNHPFLWQAGQPTQFLPYSINSNANAINDNGQVVGVNDVSQACLWQSNTVQTLCNGTADAINQSGQVVGQTNAYHAFLWQSGSGIQQLDAAGGWTSSRAYGINAGGQVVGDGATVGGRYDAFLWQSGVGMQDLDPSATWGSSHALAINNNGQVVGWASKMVRCTPSSGRAALALRTFNSLTTPVCRLHVDRSDRHQQQGPNRSAGALIPPTKGKPFC